MFRFFGTDKSMPYLRGAIVLRSILSHAGFLPSDQPYISDVYAVPGHLILLLKGGTTMVVFDSAPASLHPSVAAQQSIFAALRDSKLEALQSAMLISYHTAPVISVHVDNERLFVMQSDSTAFGWFWSASDYSWKSLGRVAMATGLYSRVVAAGFLSHSKSFLWFESSGKQPADKLVLRGIDTDAGGLSPGKTETIAFDGPELTGMTATKQGMWLLSRDPKVPSHFFNSDTLQVSTVPLPQQHCVASCFYPITGEYVVLLENGEVHVCSGADNPPTCSLLTTLPDFSPTSPSPVLDLFVHQFVIGVLRTETCSFYDWKTGALLSTEPLPSSLSKNGGGVWHRGGTAEVGIWDGRGGVWQVVYPKVATHAESLANLPQPYPALSLAAEFSKASPAALL